MVAVLVLAVALGSLAVALTTWRARAERERFRSEAGMLREAIASREAMLAAMHGGIVVLDAGGRVRYANAAARTLLGHEAVEEASPGPAELRVAAGRIRAGGERAETSFESSGRTVEAVASATDPPGSTLLVVRDVTAARRTEQLRRNFVANASHELKTPVSSILALAFALEQAIGDREATARFIPMLGREADRLSHLVSDLLDLSRLESDAGAPERVHLDQVVLDEADKLRAEAKAAGIRLRVAPPAPALVSGRRSDLGLLVQNLLGNAIRYTPAGGEVRLSLTRENGTALVTVADTGVGIPAADLDRVFERFYRVDRARDRASGGTGLGLAIVRHVAESHGGEVGVESVLGAGSTFTVRIPALRP